eukprot:scaffold23818_cov39-Cyclotella_meneghiniana.AAC.2
MLLDIKDGALSFVAQDNVMIGAKPESLCLLSSSRRGTLLFVFPFAIVRTAYHTFIWTMRDQSAGSSLTPWDYYGVMVNHTTKVPQKISVVSHFAFCVIPSLQEEESLL